LAADDEVVIVVNEAIVVAESSSAGISETVPSRGVDTAPVVIELNAS